VARRRRLSTAVHRAFGPKAIEYRTASSEARLIFTNRENRHKLTDVANCPPIVVVDSEDDFPAELARQPATFEPVPMRGDDPFLMLFTSGTTGPAKGVTVPLKALLSFYVYTRWGLDLRPEDAFWNIADPGWAYGLYYAVIGPLLLGHATTLYDGPFTVDSTYRIIRKYGIANLAGAPTAYRLLISAGEQAAEPIKGRLRVASSAGETLNPEVIRWFAKTLGCPIHDHYGQTEVGMVLCNHHGLAHPVHLGAAGLAMPGFRLAVVDDDGRELPAGTPGILAIDRKRSPLFWFPGYWQQPTINWVGDYHLTGDTVEQNADGTISFVGRSDDIITSEPDPERTELVKAFVVLRSGIEPTPGLAEELQILVKTRLAAHAYPREIEFIAEIPKTPSGKMQRFILRNQEAEKARAAMDSGGTKA
jgi:acetyl-CoA synthetase